MLDFDGVEVLDSLQVHMGSVWSVWARLFQWRCLCFRKRRRAEKGLCFWVDVKELSSRYHNLNVQLMALDPIQL